MSLFLQLIRAFNAHMIYNNLHVQVYIFPQNFEGRGTPYRASGYPIEVEHDVACSCFMKRQ
jgi:hypothetical protein